VVGVEELLGGKVELPEVDVSKAGAYSRLEF
jgi:hypothetical protein